MENGNRFPSTHPSDILDYKFDWAAKENHTGLTNWLDDGETIVSHNVTVTTGITLVSSSIVDNGTAILIWLSGGTNNTDYQISCQITTTANRSRTRVAIVPVRIT